jgi:hypothetical protein
VTPIGKTTNGVHEEVVCRIFIITYVALPRRQGRNSLSRIIDVTTFYVKNH